MVNCCYRVGRAGRMVHVECVSARVRSGEPSVQSSSARLLRLNRTLWLKPFLSPNIAALSISALHVDWGIRFIRWVQKGFLCNVVNIFFLTLVCSQFEGDFFYNSPTSWLHSLLSFSIFLSSTNFLTSFFNHPISFLAFSEGSFICNVFPLSL